MSEKKGLLKGLFGKKSNNSCCHMEITEEPEKKNDCCHMEIIEESEPDNCCSCNCTENGNE